MAGLIKWRIANIPTENPDVGYVYVGVDQDGEMYVKTSSGAVVKTSGFETSAQLNIRDTNNRNRANHTGSQTISTISGLQTALDSKVNIEDGKGLSDENYTLLEKNKLASLENPTAQDVKTLYESNPDTNAFTDNNLATLGSLVQAQQDAKEPTGFLDRISSTMTFDVGTRTFSIIPSPSFFVYIKGNKIEVNTTLTSTIPNTTDNYFFYINNLGQLLYQNNFEPSLLEEKAYCAFVYWDSTNSKLVIFGDERHGITMDAASHGHFHSTLGTQLLSGGLLNFSVGSGALDVDAQVALSDMTVADEDIRVSIVNSATPSGPFEQILNPVAQIPIIFREGDYWSILDATSFPLASGTTRPRFNKDTGGVWSLEEATQDGNYLVSYIFATTDINNPVICILGQDEYTSLEDAEARANWDSISFGEIPFREIKLLYMLVYEVDSTFTNSIKARIVKANDYRFGIDRGISASSQNTDHSNLSSLLSDDHPQYLNRSGVRSMSGNLNMDNYNIIDVGLINNVAIEAHAARHQPGGADPIPTSTASSVGTGFNNTEGISSSLSRADHTHKVEVYTNSLHLNNTVQTSSLVFEVVPGMTISPPVGEYIVNVSVSHIHDINLSETTFAIFVNGVQASLSDTVSVRDDIQSRYTDIYRIIVNENDIVDVRWFTTAGTASASSRTLFLTKVA